jgi:hypothetical protein
MYVGIKGSKSTVKIILFFKKTQNLSVAINSSNNNINLSRLVMSPQNYCELLNVENNYQSKAIYSLPRLH